MNKVEFGIKVYVSAAGELALVWRFAPAAWMVASAGTDGHWRVQFKSPAAFGYTRIGAF